MYMYISSSSEPVSLQMSVKVCNIPVQKTCGHTVWLGIIPLCYFCSGNSASHSRETEEEDFPRGGASALSPLEVRKIKDEAEKDVLFGVIDFYLHFSDMLNQP